jgi:sugar lactone lactonase YvrE
MGVSSSRRLSRAGVGLAGVVAVGVAALAGLATAEAADERTFDHVGTFTVAANLPPGADGKTPTSAEIVDATPDGRTLVYTDSPRGVVGFIGIADPSSPTPGGTIDVGGEPTSVALFRQWALVAVNTSPSYTEPSGELVVVNTLGRTIVKRIPLAGQPDSIDISPDERWAAVVIENERDEEAVVDGLEGGLPQSPPGVLQVVDLQGGPGAWKRPRTVALTGLAAIAPTDPEPEYVDINAQNKAVVSLQENNHLVLVDLPTARVVKHFPAGSASLEDVDGVRERLGPQRRGLIVLANDLSKRREPDAVAWINNDSFATANEGDYTDGTGAQGGSRGFTVFNGLTGAVEHESGARFEHALVRAGHFPELRSGSKGVEPEGVEVGVFGDRTLLFVGSERGNAVGVYDVTSGGAPELLQVLPTGIGPEGILALPSRGLLAVSAEVDGPDADEPFDVRSIVTLYALEPGKARYPYLRSSDDGSGLPIPWVAISGLAGDPDDADTLWAVSDSFLAQAYVYEIDVSSGRGVIVDRIPVGGVGLTDRLKGDFDLEGIAAREEGGFWLASEGRTGAASTSRPNLLVRIDDDGTIEQTVELPATLVSKATSSGFEGLAVTGTSAGDDEVVWVAFQREWADDPVGRVKLGRYDVEAGVWTFAHYPLDPATSPNGGWVGLSELTLLPGGKLAIVERDNQIALDARIKRVYEVDPATKTWVAHADPQTTPLPTLTKTLRRDLLAELDDASISVPDKLEGLGLTKDGSVYAATDNDGLDLNYGETLFFETTLG